MKADAETDYFTPIHLFKNSLLITYRDQDAVLGVSGHITDKTNSSPYAHEADSPVGAIGISKTITACGSMCPQG